MTRTFSKIHGLASLRIGWAYCPPAIADALNRIRGPFNLSSPAIKAGAAAIGDRQFVEDAQANTETWRQWVTSECHAMGLEVTPSVTNFVLIHFPSTSGMSAREADEYLLSKRIVLRRLENYQLPNALRMTIGNEQECRETIEALKSFLSNDNETGASLNG